MPGPPWPAELLLVRHGESLGNVARARAEATGSARIDIAGRDMDVDLSPTGQEQATALGRWLAGRPAPPVDVVVASPYRRARRTAELAASAAGLGRQVHLDERWRERELGALDRLTQRGVLQRYPEEAAARRRIGKFFHRPPGGESWCDVGLRVRSALDGLRLDHAGERVMVVTHEVVVLMCCYVLEQLGEGDVLDLGRSRPLANCSVTTFRTGADGRPVRHGFGDVDAVVASPAPVTDEADAPVAPR